MIIDFSKIDEATFQNFKGGIGPAHLRKFENELGKIFLGRLEPGCTIGLHTHETNSEIIYIISGTADFIYDPEPQEAEGTSESGAAATADTASSPFYDISETATAGECHYCPKGHTHSMINNGTEDIIFFAAIPEQ